MRDGDEARVQATGKRTLKERLAAHVDEYGRIAIITYLVLSVLAITGFSIAIGIGAEPSSATGVIGVIIAGWAAAKATLPLRILITLAITPLVAFVVRRRPRAAPAAAPAAAVAAAADAAPDTAGDVAVVTDTEST